MAGQGALRWGDDAPEDPAQARARVLDAAEECFTRYGVSKTTVEDVARAAGISRATAYRYFSDGRDEIILGVVLRETDRYLARLNTRISRQASLADAICEYVVTTVLAARREERLGRLFTGAELGTVGRLMATGSDLLFQRTTEFWGPYFGRWADQVRPGVDPVDAAEHLLRTVLSLLAVDGPRRRTTDALRAYVRRYVVPGVCLS